VERVSAKIEDEETYHQRRDTMSCDLPKCALSVVRKAIKIHRCCECNGLIKSGERYQRYSGIWRDGPCSYKTCMDCVHLRCETDSDDDGEGTR